MDTILVATDLSPRADRAVRRAFKLAAKMGAHVHVAHTVDHGLPESLAARVTDEATRLLDQFCAYVAGADGPRFTLHIGHGDVSTDIHDLARTVDAGLLILGVHHRRPILDLIRETTVERLVRLSHRPVLIVHDRADHDFAKVLSAVDFSPSSTAAAKLATRLFPDADQRGFHAVYVPFQGLTDPAGHAADARVYLREAKADLGAWAAREGTEALAEKTEVAEGALHQVLDRLIVGWHPDVLTLGAHGRTGKAPFLLGSFANDLMRDPPCDLLIVRP
ncbi:MAG: universal stress protein [Rhodobacter sp.]|nr:universal stress protein [Rhodobacter sp.]